MSCHLSCLYEVCILHSNLKNLKLLLFNLLHEWPLLTLLYYDVPYFNHICNTLGVNFLLIISTYT